MLPLNKLLIILRHILLIFGEVDYPAVIFCSVLSKEKNNSCSTSCIEVIPFICVSGAHHSE